MTHVPGRRLHPYFSYTLPVFKALVRLFPQTRP